MFSKNNKWFIFAMMVVFCALVYHYGKSKKNFLPRLTDSQLSDLGYAYRSNFEMLQRENFNGFWNGLDINGEVTDIFSAFCDSIELLSDLSKNHRISKDDIAQITGEPVSEKVWHTTIVLSRHEDLVLTLSFYFFDNRYLSKCGIGIGIQ